MQRSDRVLLTVTPKAKTRWLAVVVLPVGIGLLPAHAELPAELLGKQRAASSRLEWEIREAGHPILGNIRFAYLKTPVETPVGKDKVFSRTYFSCQRASKKFAIELVNATAPDDPKGLRPSTEPRLFCNRPIQPWDEKLVQEELLARWDINELGDALAHGFRPFPLRECVSIRVVQEVVLPQGWSQKTAKLEFDIFPYNRELDAIFATCGEVSAYAPAAPAAAAEPAKPAIASAPPAAPKPAPPADTTWQMVRVHPSGKTNVRAGPTLQSAVVAELGPGMPILVQRTGTEWWRAKSSETPAFEGFIRQDRLVFK